MNVGISLTFLLSACLLQACGPARLNPSDLEDSSDPAPMVVCTFNIRGANTTDTLSDGTPIYWDVRKASVKRFLDAVQPDIVGLQEVTGVQPEWFKSYASGNPDYGYYDVSMDKGIDPLDLAKIMKKGPGIGVLYRKDRFDLVSADYFWLDEDIHALPAWHEVTVDGKPKGVFGVWESGNPRIVLSVVLKDRKHQNTLIHFFPAHYDNFSVEARRNSAGLMVAQMKEICQEVDLKEGGAVVFHVGDLNTVSDSGLLDSLNDNLKYARTAAPGPDMDIGTYNGYRKSHSTWHIIDHIYYGGKAVKPVKYWVDRTDYGVPFLSDHFPVLFKWEYREK